MPAPAIEQPVSNHLPEMSKTPEIVKGHKVIKDTAERDPPGHDWASRMTEDMNEELAAARAAEAAVAAADGGENDVKFTVLTESAPGSKVAAATDNEVFPQFEVKDIKEDMASKLSQELEAKQREYERLTHMLR